MALNFVPIPGFPSSLIDLPGTYGGAGGGAAGGAYSGYGGGAGSQVPIFGRNPSVVQQQPEIGFGMYNPNSPNYYARQQAPTAANPPTLQQPWMPAALQSQQQGPQYARQQAREQRRMARAMSPRRSGRRGGVALNWNYSGATMPPGAGTGGYYPGTSGEAQQQVRQNAVANFVQYARANGAPQWQINEGIAAINGGQMPGGGGGGGGGGFGNQAGDLFKAMQSQTDRANKANEERYMDTLRGYYDRYQRGMSNLTGQGQQEAADINEAARGQEAAARQSLVARGLSNSTVMDNITSGVERDRRADQGRLQERLRNQVAQLDASLSGDVLGVMERREDVQPDYAQFLQLAQMLGMSGLDGGQVQQGGGGAPIFMGAGDMGFNIPGASFGLPMVLGGMGGYQSYRSRNPKVPTVGRRKRAGEGSGLGPPTRVAPPRRRYSPGTGYYDWGIGGDPGDAGGYA